ncbi:hypothetical protein PRNP1_015620 [Phytophthora ramorum]
MSRMFMSSERSTMAACQHCKYGSLRPHDSSLPSSAPASKAPKRGYKQRPPPRLAKLEKPLQICNEPNQAKDKSRCIWKIGTNDINTKHPTEVPQHLREERGIYLLNESGACVESFLQQWIATAKLTLQKLLESKHRVNVQKAESCDVNTQLILSRTIARLQREVDYLPNQDMPDCKTREQKCQRMVAKMAAIDRKIFSFLQPNALISTCITN